MSRTRLLPLVGLLCLTAGCTSSADQGSDPAASSSSAASTSAAPPTPSAELAVTNESELGVPGGSVTGARVVLAADGTPTTLLATSTGATVVAGGPGPAAQRSTTVQGTVTADLVAAGDELLAVTLTADPVAADPVLGLLPAQTGGAPNGSGPALSPVPVDPQRTAPRGLPVFAAASPDGDVLYLLAEDTEGVGATVYAVDPAGAELLDSAPVDPGLTDVTALDLGGLVVTGDGDLVVGLTVSSDDERAGGGTASLLLPLDPDLQSTGEPLDAQTGDAPAPLLAVGRDAGGEPVALVADPAEGLTLLRPDLDTGRSTSTPLAAPDLGSRATGLAVVEAGAVTTVLDQGAPTVAVAPAGGGSPTTLQLCDGSGDALAVTVGEDDTVLVAGTCEGASLLWTLG